MACRFLLELPDRSVCLGIRIDTVCNYLRFRWSHIGIFTFKVDPLLHSIFIKQRRSRDSLCEEVVMHSYRKCRVSPGNQR